LTLTRSSEGIDVLEYGYEQARLAIEFHLEALRAHDEPVPEPATTASYIDVIEVA
jgi:hypothetical protein